MRLTERQRAILTAVRDLAPNAYGVPIAEATRLPIVVIYDELDGLQGSVTSRTDPHSVERNFRPRIFWELTNLGRAALAQSVEKK